MDQVGLGKFGEQSTGEVLSVDGRRQEAAGDRTRDLDRLSSAITLVLGRAVEALMITELLTRLRFLVLRKKPSELDEELSFHLEQSIAAKQAAGLNATEARRQAMIEFGGVERTREQCAETTPWMVARHREAGCAPRTAAVAQVAWPDVGGRGNAGAGNWCKHGHFQHGGRDMAEAASYRGSPPTW